MLIKALCLVAVACAALVPLPAATGDRLKAAIPFHFRIGRSELRPGTYTFERNQQSGLLSIRDEWGGGIVILTTPGTAGSSPARRLVFHRLGATYSLAEVQLAAGMHAAAVPQESGESFASFTFR